MSSTPTGSGWRENVESFSNLQENLIENHLSLLQIPYVIQYNKRDIPNAAPVNYLEFTFNNRANRALAFEAVAATGEGVLETLNACARMLLAKYSKNPNSNVAGVIHRPGSCRRRAPPGTPRRRRAKGIETTMSGIGMLTAEDQEWPSSSQLADFLKKSEAQWSALVDKGGNLFAQSGNTGSLDLSILSALAAGSFAATHELARRLGESEFSALYHEGRGQHILMSALSLECLLVTVFGDKTNIGLVRFYAQQATASLERPAPSRPARKEGSIGTACV